MIFARRLTTEDDLGNVTTDYEGVDVPRAARRAIPIDDTTPSGRRRLAKLRAIAILRRDGMRPADIALALDLSERWVFDRSARMRELAEAGCRV